MIEKISKKETNNKLSNDLYLEQYKALQQEIIQRTQIQYQIVGLSLVIFGTIFTIGFERNSPIILMIYPILAFFLSSIWAQNDMLIREVRHFIISTIEKEYYQNFKGWETHRDILQNNFGIFSILRSSRRIFTGMQVISILAAIWIFGSQKSITLFETVFLILNFLLIIFSALLLKRRANKQLE